MQTLLSFCVEEQAAEALRLEAELADPPPDLSEVEEDIFNNYPSTNDAEAEGYMSPTQVANLYREYGRVEKLAQREILKVEKEYARDRDSQKERDTKVPYSLFILHIYHL